ncbi:hypothetical protein SAMN04515668_4827 [Hymenobacter arizonensis]|uniref:Uncharacterized protein n=1 Tax=Hymenobacter arizonensis TaxID=1227077 RepID=A0A1I6BNK9_HYMAR|nr:hypothetical protein SAMN04515668_4827 [Hymenobacter arizonensis]
MLSDFSGTNGKQSRPPLPPNLYFTSPSLTEIVPDPPAQV